MVSLQGDLNGVQKVVSSNLTAPTIPTTGIPGRLRGLLFSTSAPWSLQVVKTKFAQRAAEGAQKVLGANHPDTVKYQKLWREFQTTNSPPQP